VSFNDTTLLQSESILFFCVGYSQNDLQITWYHNESRLQTSNSSKLNIHEEEVIEEENKFHYSFLQLCDVEVADSGTYACYVSNGPTTVNSSATVTVLG